MLVFTMISIPIRSNRDALFYAFFDPPRIVTNDPKITKINE